MGNSDFWTARAEALELSLEGNRLIAQEIVALLRGVWRRSIRSLDIAIHGLGQHRHLPPV